MVGEGQRGLAADAASTGAEGGEVTACYRFGFVSDSTLYIYYTGGKEGKGYCHKVVHAVYPHGLTAHSKNNQIINV